MPKIPSFSLFVDVHFSLSLPPCGLWPFPCLVGHLFLFLLLIAFPHTLSSLLSFPFPLSQASQALMESLQHKPFLHEISPISQLVWVDLVHELFPWIPKLKHEFWESQNPLFIFALFTLGYGKLALLQERKASLASTFHYVCFPFIRVKFWVFPPSITHSNLFPHLHILIYGTP